MARLVLAPFRAPAVRNLLRGLTGPYCGCMLRIFACGAEFNRWAQNGMDETMELDHSWLAERIIPKMRLSSEDCILDLGCGGGWTCRRVAESLNGLGYVVGLDISDEMVRRARIKNTHIENLAFLCGSAEHIPCRDETFTRLLSISAFYYFEHQEEVLKELFRILEPNGSLFLLTCLYKELPEWRSTSRQLRVPVRVRGADEYKAMLEAAGWRDVHSEELLQQCEEAAGNNPGHDRALLISARKPA